MVSLQVSQYAREQMVAQQIRAWDVLDDDVLDLFRHLARETFVPAAFRDVAYADTQIPLGKGQHMLAPKVAGRIVQAMTVARGDQLLEVGTGSGFLSACFALQGAGVRSLEIHAELAAQARLNLAAAGLGSVQVETADAYLRLAATPAYDAIVITASMPFYDARFEAQLKPGGRLFVVVGEGPAMDARLITRDRQGGRREESLFETVLDPLVNALHVDTFRF
jgi:protein-L-isoaspartate(D-aspartate) O-methyltransferase